MTGASPCIIVLNSGQDSLEVPHLSQAPVAVECVQACVVQHDLRVRRPAQKER